MAGFVGDARQWRKFEKRAAKLFTRFRVDIFHSIDLRRGEIELLDEFQHIINETLESGVASFIRADDYAYYCGLE